MAEKITTIIKDKIKSKFPDLFSGFYNSEKVAGLLLVFCTLFSLGLTNSGFADGYSRLTNAHVDLSFAGIGLDLSIEHWINDGLMAIFFLMVGLEVERELYVGELAEFKKAILPLAAAIGGICLPSLIHFFLNKGTPTQPGFAIPMATDIAFALGILALAGDRVPIAVKIFLTALAIIDDIGAILVIAIFYTKTVLFGYLLVALGILAIFFVVRKRKIRIFWCICCPAWWYGIAF